MPKFTSERMKSRVFYLRNVGNGLWREPRVTAMVASPGRFECLVYESEINYTPKDPCEVASIGPSDLAPDTTPKADSSLEPRQTDMQVRVYFTAPADAKYAYIYITVFGEGLPSDTYGVTVLL